MASLLLKAKTKREEVAPMQESRPMISTMSQDITLDCVDLSGTTRQLEAELTYDALDPFAITMTFHTRQGDVPWVFSRELLLSGLADPAGEGDVHVWPSIDLAGRAIVVIELHSNSGSFVAQARTPEIYRFLTRTMSMVALGSEAIDVDAMIDSLLPS
jgi:Streptomyces sporulation and cell division protein, SsgA